MRQPLLKRMIPHSNIKRTHSTQKRKFNIHIFISFHPEKRLFVIMELSNVGSLRGEKEGEGKKEEGEGGRGGGKGRGREGEKVRR